VRPRPSPSVGAERQKGTRPLTEAGPSGWSIVWWWSRCEPSWGAGVGYRDRRRCRRGLGVERWGGKAPRRSGPGISKEVLRKEVIQPQVPLRLPCYDLVPITGFIFGACLAAPATSDAPRFGGLTGGVYKAQEHIHRGMLIRDY
jgi:hypothetical protein